MIEICCRHVLNRSSSQVRLAEGNKFPFNVDQLEDITEEEKDIAGRVEEKVLQYYKRMTEISKVCLAAIAHSLGIPFLLSSPAFGGALVD